MEIISHITFNIGRRDSDSHFLCHHSTSFYRQDDQVILAFPRALPDLTVHPEKLSISGNLSGLTGQL